MFRRLLLSTVCRNVPDGAGGGGAPKPDDAAAAAPVVADAAAAPAAADPAPIADAPAPAAADPAPAADAAPADAKVEEQPADKDFVKETLLTGDEPKPDDKAAPAAPTEAPKADAKPAEAAKVEDAKPGEAAADGQKKPDAAVPEPPKEAPVYAYEFPEGIKVDAEALKPANELFAKHGVAPDAAKELMGLHVQQMKAYADHVVEQTSQQQRDVWANTRSLWREEGKSDEQIGGAGYETSVRQAAEVRDRLVGKDQMAAFNRMLLVTGVGDHPEFLRFMKNAHRFVAEPSLQNHQPGNPTKTNGQPGGRRRIRDTYKTA